MQKSLPQIVNAEKVAEYLSYSVKTISRMAYREEWMPGIYLGRGRYNMDRLKQYIENPPHRFARGRSKA